MKKIILVVAALVIVVVLSFNKINAGGLVDSQEFMTKFENSPNAVLLDVRTPAEFKISHIPGSVNLDYENINFETEVKKLDSSREYFIYCRSGNRSSKALPIMKKSGIKIMYDLKGSIAGNPDLLK